MVVIHDVYYKACVGSGNLSVRLQMKAVLSSAKSEINDNGLIILATPEFLIESAKQPKWPAPNVWTRDV
jgi:hypothetical protein